MIMEVKTLKNLIKFFKLRNLMIKLTKSKKISPAISFNTETDMTL